MPTLLDETRDSTHFPFSPCHHATVLYPSEDFLWILTAFYRFQTVDSCNFVHLLSPCLYSLVFADRTMIPRPSTWLLLAASTRYLGAFSSPFRMYLMDCFFVSQLPSHFISPRFLHALLAPRYATNPPASSGKILEESCGINSLFACLSSPSNFFFLFLACSAIPPSIHHQNGLILLVSAC